MICVRDPYGHTEGRQTGLVNKFLIHTVCARGGMEMEQMSAIYIFIYLIRNTTPMFIIDSNFHTHWKLRTVQCVCGRGHCLPSTPAYGSWHHHNSYSPTLITRAGLANFSVASLDWTRTACYCSQGLKVRMAIYGPVRLSEFRRNLDGLEECWRNL